MPTYAVTGASGHLGHVAVQQLLACDVPASDVVAVVRTRGKAADLAARGVQVRAADYSRPQALGAALAGVDRLLLVSSSEPGQRVAQHTNVIEAAKTAGVAQIVYTSMLNVDDTTNPLAGEHQESERALREAGVPFTLLRNGWYTENYTDQLDQYRARRDPRRRRRQQDLGGVAPGLRRRRRRRRTAPRRGGQPDLRARWPGLRPARARPGHQ